jgi:hypothetical protein
MYRKDIPASLLALTLYYKIVLKSLLNLRMCLQINITDVNCRCR